MENEPRPSNNGGYDIGADQYTDSDGGGLPDWWQWQYFDQLGNGSASTLDGNGFTLLQDYLGGVDPTNYYTRPNSSGPVTLTPILTVVSGNNQTSSTGGLTAQPLVVRVTDSSGTPLANAPVKFIVMSGGGGLVIGVAGPVELVVESNTDAHGNAQVYYQEPANVGVTSAIAATTDGQTVNFTETSGTSSQPPQITSAATVTTAVNAAFGYAITASNVPTNFSATGLPSGLAINTTTGIISGTPSTTGIFSVHLSATNSSGTSTGVLVISIESSSTAPEINSPAAAIATVDSSLNYQITASHNPTFFGATNLPTGISIDPMTGIISGTATTTGTYTINLSAGNGAGTGTAVLSLAVNAAGNQNDVAGVPVITSNLAATVTPGPWTYSITATQNPTSYGAVDLPDGLSLNPSTGIISGTPVNGGNYSVLVSANNATGTTTAVLKLTMALPPAVTNSPMANATVGTSFYYLVQGTNAPTSYAISSLPPGLTFNSSTGVISGTPTTPGVFSTQVTASNASGQSGPLTLTLTVSPAAAPAITSPTIAYATIGQVFTYQITASNNPTAFSVPAGGLPAGLSLNSATGVISGTPSTVGTPSVVISASNSVGQGTGNLVIVEQAATAGATSTMILQSGVSPTTSYQATSAYVASDTSDPTVANETAMNLIYSSYDTLIAGGASATESARMLLGFDLSVVPPSATIQSASLVIDNLYQDLLRNNPLKVELHQAAGPFSPQSATWLNNSGYNSTLLSSLSCTTGSTANTWSSSDAFVSAVQSVSAQAGTLNLLLVSPEAEFAGAPEYILIQSYDPGPKLEITYTTASPPIFTGNSSTFTITPGAALHYSFNAINIDGVTNYSASGLPSGLSINSTGTITGTTTATGSYSVIISANNENGTGSQTITLNVGNAPTMASSLTASATANSPFTYTISAANSPTSFSASSLPSGLTLDPQSGIISGTPGINTVGTYSIALTATNAIGSATATLNLTIAPTSPTITGTLTPIRGNLNAPIFYYQVPTSGKPTSFSLSSNLTSLGLSIDANGTITGTPLTTTTSEGIQGTVMVSNSVGSASASLTVIVAGVTSSSMANAQVGVPFSYNITDNDSPTNFQVSNLTPLPPGLGINSRTGVISGTPVAADDLAITLIVTDAAGTETSTLLLTIAPSSSDSQISFQQGVSPTSIYVAPATMIEYDDQSYAAATQTFNTGSVLKVGQTGTTTISRALLGFDLSALPANATITSATLVMNVPSGNSSGLPLSVEVHQLGTSFDATTATWYSNPSYNNSVLGSLVLDPSTAGANHAFVGTAAFTQAAQQAYSQNSPLYLALLSPTAEAAAEGGAAGWGDYPWQNYWYGGSVTPDYMGLTFNASNPAQNPQLMVTYTLAPPTKPVITSSSTVNGTVNLPVNYSTTATGNPQSFSATGLPSGLTLNATTGTISGTVTSVGSTMATLSATNSAGTGSQTVTFNIDNATPPTTLQIVSGNNQVGAPGMLLTSPLKVKALVGEAVLPNALITFTVSPGDGAFTNNSGVPATSNTLTVVTDGNGVGTIYFQLPQTLRTTTIIASAGTAQPISLVETSAVNSTSSNDSLVVLSALSGEGQTGPAGQTLPQPFVVQATNASGQPIADQALSLSVLSGGGTFTNGSGSVVTNSSGQAIIYFQPGGSNGTVNKVACVASSGGPQTSVYLTALTGSTTASNVTPGGGTAPNTDPGPAIPATPSGLGITPFFTISGTGLDLDFNSLDSFNPSLELDDSTHITLSWTPVDGATGYEVDRMENDNDTWHMIYTGSGASCADTGLVCEITYQYRVYAISGPTKSVPAFFQSYRVADVKAVELTYSNGEVLDIPFYNGMDDNADTTDFQTWPTLNYPAFDKSYKAVSYKVIFNPGSTAQVYDVGGSITLGTYVSPAGGIIHPGDSNPTFLTFLPEEILYSAAWYWAYGETESVSWSGGGSEHFIVKENGAQIENGATVNASKEAAEYGVWDYNPPRGEVFTVIPDPQTVQSGDSITIHLQSDFGSATVTYTYQVTPPDLSIPLDEASGSRYRKIALNGLPMSDEKPQQSAESDQEGEETYVDALTLGLRHSTTDVYLPVSGSDFSVSARRDFRSQVWNSRSGLRPHEQPDLPFGVCWSSNLAPNIKFVRNNDPNNPTPDQAIVTDETGAVHTFYLWYDGNGGLQYFPMPSAKNEAQVPNLETLTANGAANPVTYTFSRKYGATLTYQATTLNQGIANDRLLGSNYGTSFQYARLVQAVDRVGNTVNYQFQGTTNLIPETITVANQPGIKLSIQQTPLSGISNLHINSPQSVITAIWDANGNKTSYGYSVAPGDPTAAVLSTVTTPDGATTQYTYSDVTEADLTPKVSSDPGSTYTYTDISSITDPLGHTYAFSYALDHSKLNYLNNPQIPFTGKYTQSGSPRNIATVTMPDSTQQHLDVAKFINNSNVYLQNGQNGSLTVGGQRVSTVTDATGFTRTYTFGNASVVSLPSFAQSQGSTESKIVAYQNLTIGYGSLGSETFQFDIDAAMALKQITDLSGNVTTFAHTDYWSAPATYSHIISGATLNGYYDDPTSQTDALGHAKTFTYFGPNRILQSSTDENGNRTYYDIDSLGRRTTEKLYDHDPGHALVQETDFAYGNPNYPGFMTQKAVQALAGSGPSWAHSLVTQYVPDANGRVAQEVVDPNGLHLVTTYSYDANGNKLTATDPKGNTTWFSYDTRNRLVTVTAADGTQKQMVYDNRGNKSVEYDEKGIATLYQYDSLNRLTAQARHMAIGSVQSLLNTQCDVSAIPSGDIITSYTYSNVNSKLTTRAPTGGTTRMQYDNLQRVTDIYTSPDNSAQYHTQFSYGTNSGGNAFDSSSFKPTRTVDPRGFATKVTYDALYRPVAKAVQYNLGGAVSTTSTQYDNVGNAVRVTDPLGHQTATTYDALNRPVVTTLADNTTEQESYTSTGFKWKTIDPNGNATQTQYDAAGRATEVIGAVVSDGHGNNVSPVTQTFYDAAGNVAETINPLGKIWDYVYDARNRKVKEFEPAVLDADPASSTYNTTVRPSLTWKYDAAGLTTSTLDARGNETDTLYDAANRVTDVNSPQVPVAGGSAAGPNVHSTYDADGNVLTLRDANGHTTTNTYDLLNRLLTSKDAAGITVTNTYDQVGNKLSVRDGNLHTTSFVYDGLNRNIAVTDAAGNATQLRYDGLNKTQRIDALGQVTTYLYDVRNRLQHVVYASSTAANSQRDYAYDGVGNLLSVTESAKTVANVGYTYDALNRVVTETSQGRTHTYVYDLAGNRLSTVYGGTSRTLTSTYDALNRLGTMTESGRETQYAYDLNGNVVQKTAPNGDTEATAYDALNRASVATTDTGAGSLLCQYNYGYDLAGNVATVAETYPGASGVGNRLVTNTTQPTTWDL
jgi:YD repeat-containing protein